jgi:hypothetical protein
MLRETLHVNTATDVEDVVSRLRAKCADAGLAPALAEILLNQTREILSALVEQGRRIAAVGSQMEVTRDLVGDGYSIKLIFREGVRRGFFERLFGWCFETRRREEIKIQKLSSQPPGGISTPTKTIDRLRGD